MATTSGGVDTLRMRAALLVCIAIVLEACVGQTSAPSPSPASATPATTTPVATPIPSPSPSPTPRTVRPFDRVVALPGLGDETFFALDRERVAFIEGTDGIHGKTLNVLEVATGRKRTVHQTSPGWILTLSPRGLRGDTLVLGERRSEGQRTDGRVIRIDLRANTTVTLDEWSGPFLGGGDTLHADPPITNGTDVVWTRITADRQPFAVELVLARGATAPRVVSTSTSAAWADLHDDGRIAVSTFITRGDRSELVIWRDGQVTSVGTRGAPGGGPARFVGDRVFWAIGPGFVAPIERGQLITIGGTVQDVEFRGCSWNGATARYLVIACGPSPTGTSTWSLLDPVSGVRDAIPAVQLVVGAARAVVWREGTQWWFGTLPP